MNEYLAKLHSLESAPKGQGAKKHVVESPTKPTEQVLSGFVSDRSMRFFGGEARPKENNTADDMQNVISTGLKNPYHSVRQNRQNLVAASFPFAGALDQLERRCPDHIEAERCHQCLIDAQRFLAAWGDKAAALGWTEADLFGLHEPLAKPHPTYSRLSRYDCTGLLWLLRGRRVVALTADTAAIESASGATLTYRRTVASELYEFTEKAVYPKDMALAPWAPTQGKISNLLDAPSPIDRFPLQWR